MEKEIKKPTRTQEKQPLTEEKVAKMSLFVLGKEIEKYNERIKNSEKEIVIYKTNVEILTKYKEIAENEILRKELQKNNLTADDVTKILQATSQKSGKLTAEDIVRAINEYIPKQMSFEDSGKKSENVGAEVVSDNVKVETPTSEVDTNVNFSGSDKQKTYSFSTEN
jgi:hypothetical protein